MAVFLRLFVLFFCSSIVAARAFGPSRVASSLASNGASIASRAEPPNLLKRTQINFNGFPAAGDLGETDVNRYIDQIAQLAQYIVRNVRRNHAVYLRFFGTDEFYDDAMRVIERIATIRNGNGGPSLNINYHNTNGPDDIGANGQIAPAAAQYENVQGQPTLDIYNQWPSTRDIMLMVPGQTTTGMLEQFARTRQGVILHEVGHLPPLSSRRSANHRSSSTGQATVLSGASTWSTRLHIQTTQPAHSSASWTSSWARLQSAATPTRYDHPPTLCFFLQES
jgi:hypothetical protein